MVSQNATTEINYAKANGNDWYTEVLADRLLIQDLLVMMGKSTDGQTVYGKGRCDTNSAVNTGTMNSRGMFWGSNNGTDGVKVFGMEHFWGNLWRRTAGWMNVNGTQKVKLTRGTKDGSTASDYNTDGNGYKTVSGATPSGTSGGYISSMKTEGFGRIPVTASGSSSTFEADGLWYNNSGTMYAFVGGYWNNGLPCGPFCANLRNAPSVSGSDSGAALSCKPLATGVAVRRGEVWRTLGSPEKTNIKKGYVLRKAAIVGGNWNNDLQCGPFYANLNNTPSNSNSNNGAALSYPIRSFSLNAVHIAVKNSKRQFVSSSPLGEN